MKRTFIISLLFLLALLASGCPSGSKGGKTPSSDNEPALIFDRYGFKIMDLDGFTEDKTPSSLVWNVLTLRAEDVRIQFGYIKGAKVMSDIPGMPAPTERQTLYDWAMGMLQTSRFYPATTKSILSNDYLEIDGRNAMVLNVLLESDEEYFKAREQLAKAKELVQAGNFDDARELVDKVAKVIIQSDQAIQASKHPLTSEQKKAVKSEIDKYSKQFEAVQRTNGEELDFINKHKNCILKVYLIFRGRDIFHVEIFTDSLTYLVVQKKFDTLVMNDLKFSDREETPNKS
jgi:hypothetical protein